LLPKRRQEFSLTDKGEYPVSESNESLKSRCSSGVEQLIRNVLFSLRKGFKYKPPIAHGSKTGSKMKRLNPVFIPDFSGFAPFCNPFATA
jgi:hypothetical protein